MNLRITRGEETLSDIQLEDGEYIIGSGDSAQLRIESELIAPEHARLRIYQGSAEVEDLGSGCGTWLGDSALTGAQPLPPYTPLQLGDIALQVWENESSSARRESAQTPERYIVGPVVAAGAMGVVHTAREVHTGREVAMKQMKDGRDVARFVQEAKITAHLEHPNIVPVHDVNPGSEGPSYYTMKMVRGVTLEQLLKSISKDEKTNGRRYTLEELLTIFQKLCDGMAFAHSKKVIHRDLKPANIMLGEYGEVLVMDWGLAKVVGESSELPATADLRDEQAGGGALTISGTIMGTPQYMAPEQACGDHEFVDERSDVYALGAILYEILTLRPPVEGITINEVLRNVVAGKIIPPQERVAGKLLPHIPGGRIPNSLTAVAMKALSLSPDRRYSSVKELQTEVAAYQSGRATGAERAGIGRQLALLVGRNKGVFAVGGGAVAALIVLATVFVFRLSQETNRARDGESRALAGEDSAKRNAEAAAQSETAAKAEKARAEESARLAQESESRARENEKRAIEQERLAKLATEETKAANIQLAEEKMKLEDEKKTTKSLESSVVMVTKEKELAKEREQKALESKVTKRLADIAPATDAAAQSGDFSKVLVNSVFLISRELAKGDAMNRNMLTVHQRRLRAALNLMPRLLFVRTGALLARISPDASRVALFDSNKGAIFNTERLYETGVMQQLGAPTEYPATSALDGVAFSGNSSMLFAALPTAPGQFTVRQWYARSGELLRTDPPSPKISGVIERFLPFPDGSKVALIHNVGDATAQRKEVSVWDLNSASRKSSGRFAMNGAAWAILPVPRSNTFQLQSIGKGAAADRGALYSLDATSLLMRTLTTNDSPLSQAVSFSPDGSRMVRLVNGQLGLGGKPQTLSVIRGADATGIPLRSQAAEKQLLIDVTTGSAFPAEIAGGESVFSPDSQWLLIGAGGNATLCDARNNDPTRKLDLSLSGQASHLTFSADSARAIVASEANDDPERGFGGASISAWHTSNGRRANPDILLSSEPRDISISANGRYILSTGDTATLWDTAPAASRQSVDFEKFGELENSAIWVSADARRAVVIPVNSPAPNLNIRAYDLTSTATRPMRSQILQFPPESGCWLTDNGRFFLVWGQGFGARLWDIEKNAEREIFNADPRTVKRAYSEFQNGRGVVVIESPTDNTLGLVAVGARASAKVDTSLVFQGETGTLLDTPSTLSDRLRLESGIQRVHDLDGEETLRQTAVKLKLEGALPPNARRAIYSQDKKLVAILCTSAAEPAIASRILSPLVFDGELAVLPAENLAKREIRDFRLRNVAARAWRLHIYDVGTGACLVGNITLPALVAFRWEGSLAVALSANGKWTEIDLTPDTRPIEDLIEITTLLTGRALDRSTGTVARSQITTAGFVSAWSRLQLKYKGRGWQAEDQARNSTQPK